MFRSLLYVPANNEKFISKAHLRGADCIIVDLEDGVAESEKDGARTVLEAVVGSVGREGATVFVRVNHTPQRMLEDVEAAFRSGAYGIYLPKVSAAGDIDQLDVALKSLELRHPGREPIPVVALIEGAAGVLDARQIAATPRVLGLGVGADDLATSLGGVSAPEVLRIPKMLVHLAAKASHKLSFGLFRSIADYRDLKAIESAISEARAFGFDGSTCIHPGVVSLLNKGFAPTADEINYARRLLAAAAAKRAEGIGAFLFEGNFVESPMIKRAEQLVAYSERVAEHENQTEHLRRAS